MNPPWATRELGYAVTHHDSPLGLDTTELVLPGLRRNPRRAHLLVSTVLGKHLSTDPAAVAGAGHQLGMLALKALGLADDGAAPAVVFGFAETATGLGHLVTERMGAECYLHSTRREAWPVSGEFVEAHSHATQQLLQPIPAGLLHNSLPMVLVDDEMSTGATSLDAIRTLHRAAPRERYVLATLVDMRGPAHHALVRRAEAELGVRIATVALAHGEVLLPDNIIDAVVALPAPELNPVANTAGTVSEVALPWPSNVPDTGRHGLNRTDMPAFSAAVQAAATAILHVLASDRPVVVVGHEELMYLPLQLALTLQAAGVQALYQTTSRSPAYVVDEPGYPLRRGFQFIPPEPGADGGARYLYNARWPDRDGALVILVVDAPADSAELRGPGGLVDVLTTAGTDVLIAALPGTDLAALHRERETKEGHQ